MFYSKVFAICGQAGLTGKFPVGQIGFDSGPFGPTVLETFVLVTVHLLDIVDLVGKAVESFTVVIGGKFFNQEKVFQKIVMIGVLVLHNKFFFCVG